LQFYLKPVGEPRCLFTILNENGCPEYEVVGKDTSLGCKFFLLDGNQNVVGRITGVRISDAVQYSVAAGGKRLRVAVNYTSVRRPVRIRGKRWRFRGNMLTRSFDILNAADQVVMTHGKCWSMARDCYAIDILDGDCVLLFLCLAAIIDLTISSGCTAPLPAGG
jgi:uncharacterized protein YxjI